jgi:hypothetical protein
MPVRGGVSFAEICTSTGLKRIAIAPNSEPAPDQRQSSDEAMPGSHCPFCLAQHHVGIAGAVPERFSMQYPKQLGPATLQPVSATTNPLPIEARPRAPPLKI